ncbi:hypothetical protein V1478_009421 [Vespula squamosa]|uniref:Uncharacterized protein n=1 Tax=Vespula squamosa TaxID=30214 RepID=A0ABD2APM6_VESSQ
MRKNKNEDLRIGLSRENLDRFVLFEYACCTGPLVPPPFAECADTRDRVSGHDGQSETRRQTYYEQETIGERVCNKMQGTINAQPDSQSVELSISTYTLSPPVREKEFSGFIEQEEEDDHEKEEDEDEDEDEDGEKKEERGSPEIIVASIEVSALIIVYLAVRVEAILIYSYEEACSLKIFEI